MEQKDSTHFPGTRASRKRTRTSHTGQSPIQDDKGMVATETPVTGRWSEKDTLCLRQYVAKHPVPKTAVGRYWEDYRIFLQKTTGIQPRSWQSYKAQYHRNKIDIEQRIVSTEEDGGLLRDIASQTEPAVPILQRRSSEARTLPYVVQCSDTLSEGATPAAEAFHRSTKHRVDDAEDISLADKAQIMDALHETTDSFVETLLAIPVLRKALEKSLIHGIERSASVKSVKNNSSVLFQTDCDGLQSFKWEDVAMEMAEYQPFLLKALLCVAMPVAQIGNSDRTMSLVPKLGLIYAILMQARLKELCRVQKVAAVFLKNEQTHEKVFDRLQALGVTTNYETSMQCIDSLGKANFDQLKSAVQEGKTFRIIGDNVNFKTAVRHEREHHHGGTKHWFASAAVIQHDTFDELPEQPQGSVLDLTKDQLCPSADDKHRLKHNYKVSVLKIASKFLPFVKQFEGLYESSLDGVMSEKMAKKSVVVPLPVLPYNEQQYSDVCNIMKSYVDTIDEIYDSSVHPPVHVGGDQLTRERMSGAKGLKAGGFDERDRLKDLYPVTFELWHLSMNYLSMAYQKFFASDCYEVGTMNGEKVRIRRNDVNQDVKNHYDCDKEFFVSFVQAYIVEAVCQHFGIDDVAGKPTKNIPPEGVTSEWLDQEMDGFIDNYVFAENNHQMVVEDFTEETFTPVKVKISETVFRTIYLCNRKKKQRVKPMETDHVQQYAHMVLQVGLLFLELLDTIHRPDRDRLLCCLKFVMVMLKIHKSRSKYALEILRLLCHQQASYSLKTAHQSLYGLFVNTRGLKDSHIPADLAMEHMVKRTKKLLKSVGPKNKDKSLLSRSRAVAAMDIIADNFDRDTKVRVRAGFHNVRDSHSDELKMLDDIHKLKPFQPKPGRHFSSHKNAQAPADQIDQLELDSWMDYHKLRLHVDPGK